MSPYYSGFPGRHPMTTQRILETLGRTATFGLMKSVLGPRAPDLFGRQLTTLVGHPMEKELQALHGRPADTRMFKNALVGREATALLEETKSLARRFYELRMAGMIRYAQQRGVHVILATLPRAPAMAPLLSGLHSADREEVDTLYTHLRSVEPQLASMGARTDMSQYEVLIDQVLEKDDKIALARYLSGLRHLSKGNREKGLEDLYAAVEWDLVPDITPSINAIIEDLSDRYDTPLLNLIPITEEHIQSPYRYMLDSIHINRRGGAHIGAYAAEQMRPALETQRQGRYE